MSKVNNELKAEIIRKHGCQYPFAARLGIREAFVSAVIRGHAELDELQKNKWAKALGADVNKLFPEGK